MKLSIVSHFYENPKVVEALLRIFSRMDEVSPNAFDFVLVDDHSHHLIDQRLFEQVANLRVFRIVEDVAWNMPAARNIGVHEALCDKVVLMDIDHAFDPADTLQLLAEADQLEPLQVASFRRVRGTKENGKEILPHVNSFMIHKADFARFGGYEESFSGNYGHEDKFFRVCCRRNGIKEILFKTTLYVHGVATPHLDRDRSVNTEILHRLLGYRATKPEKTMGYTWNRIHPPLLGST